MNDDTTPIDIGDDEASPAAPARHPALHRALQIGRVLFVLAVVAAVVVAMVSQWDEIVRTFSLLSWKSLAATVASIALAMLCGVKVWQHLLAAMGTEIRFGHAAQVNLVGQLGKYLPGSVWAFVLQAQLGKQFKIPRARALVSLLLTAGMTIVTAMTLGAFLAAPLADRWGGWAWLFAAGPLTLVALLPPVLTRIANLVLRVMRRLQVDANLRAAEVAKALAWSFATAGLYGLHLWLLTGSLARQTMSGYFLATGAIAIAMAAGFIAFVLPSGIGVREAILVAALAPIATTSQALAIALASRILFTIADLVSAGVGVIFSRATLRNPEGRHATTTALSEHRRVSTSSQFEEHS